MSTAPEKTEGPLLESLRAGKVQWTSTARYLWGFSLFPAMLRPKNMAGTSSTWVKAAK